MAMILQSLALACFVSLAGAFTFLDVGEVSTHDAEAALLLELEGAFGPSATKDRLDKLQEGLWPMFASLPKNEDGNLDHNVVRYVLHRLLLQQHGWFITGLEPSKTGLRAFDQDLRENSEIPSFLQSFMERRLHNDVHLRHLAVLAATLEDLVHKEAVSRLEAVYKGLSFPLAKTLDARQSTEVIDTYMMVFLKGGNISSVSPEDLRRKRDVFMSQYPEWDSVANWEHGLLSKTNDKGVLSFAAATKVVEQIGERFGAFNDGECADLKKEMLSFESSRPGRVRLSEFYNRSRYSRWGFIEKADYLRALGALDESTPQQLHVIVPNYVMSRSNCLEASNFFEVCCRNECEDLMGHLEQNILGPTARVSRIAAMVANLPSASVKAPRALSPDLLRRLDDVAEGNGGRVPLHGRLFAQWMHHAFPRECPFPHTDATSPQTPDEWMATNEHLGTAASEDEMTECINAADGAEVHAATELPWIGEERLLVNQSLPQQLPSQTPMAEQPRSQTPTTSPSSVSLQNFALFFLVAMLLAILGFALARVPSITHGLESIAKKGQTVEVSWRESAQAAFAIV